MMVTATKQTAPNTYETSDLDAAACCLASGTRLLEVTRPNGGGRAIFVFDDAGDMCQDIEGQFVQNALTIPARTLLRSLSELKFQLHQV